MLYHDVGYVYGGRTKNCRFAWKRGIIIRARVAYVDGTFQLVYICLIRFVTSSIRTKSANSSKMFTVSIPLFVEQNETDENCSFNKN